MGKVIGKHVAIIGSGFAGLSSASYLAKAGFKVTVFEKNEQIGGRARQLEAGGYTFDMGPSWYWMPDVFEKFFADFGTKPSDFYQLDLLEPAYRLIFQDDEMDIPESFESLCELFEKIEKGSAERLKQFMAGAEYKYQVGIEKLVYKPGLSLTEFIDKDLIKGIFKLDVFNSFSKHVKKYFKNPKLIALMEFPVLFLGAMPKDTPALYSLMNYAGLKLGTWYPQGGFKAVINGMHQIVLNHGVQLKTGEKIIGFEYQDKEIVAVKTDKETLPFDAVIASADYHHIENEIIAPEFRNYSEDYWDKRVLAPSSLIFYIGVNKRVPRLQHHNLFFDADFEAHAESIYREVGYPKKPLFYVCCPSKTDNSVAPEGHENLFILMPIASGLKDTEAFRSEYFDILMHRLEKYVGEDIRNHIDYQKSYAVNDFTADYNAYKGNAYGLANTLMQTANLKPTIKNKKLKNLFYAGQLTVPGPGVPPSIISGNIASQQIVKLFKDR